MKKLLILFASISVSGCYCPPSSYNEKTITHYDGYYVDRFEYNGHYYLEFHFGENSIVHDPDCKKCNKKLDW